MDTRHNMIFIKDEIKTSEVISCQHNRETYKWDVKFAHGKTYTYK